MFFKCMSYGAMNRQKRYVTAPEEITITYTIINVIIPNPIIYHIKNI